MSQVNAETAIDFAAFRAAAERREQRRMHVLPGLVQTAIDQVLAVIRMGAVPVVGYSSGKDSLTCLHTSLQAAKLAVAEGLKPVVAVVHADTMVENPLVHELAATGMAAAEAFGREHGFRVITKMVRPLVNRQMVVRMISGRALPSYLESNSDCTSSWKIDPANAFKRELRAEMLAEGRLGLVSVSGTRLDESARRKANMMKRGESEGVLSLGDGKTVALSSPDAPEAVSKKGADPILTPIAEWETGDVLAFLSDAPERFEAFDATVFSDTKAFYNDASGSECTLDFTQVRNGGMCGARSGCWSCLKTGVSDKSMVNLLMSGEFDWMRPLNDFRNYLLAIQFDMTKRRWLSRGWESLTMAIRVAPNCFSAETCKELLAMLLTMDVREKDRADAMAADIAAGIVSDTDANRRLAKPQFQIVAMDALAAIDYYWSLDGLTRPHEAIRIWFDVVGRGQLLDVPKVSLVEQRPDTAMPAERIIVPSEQSKAQALRAPIPMGLALSAWDSDELFEEAADGEGAQVRAFWGMEDSFTVDANGVEAAIGMDLARMLEVNASGAEGSRAAAEYWLTLGVVRPSSRTRRLMGHFMERTQLLHANGLLGDPSIREIEARCTLMGADDYSEHLKARIDSSPVLGSMVHELISRDLLAADGTLPNSLAKLRKIATQVERAEIQAAQAELDPSDEDAFVMAVREQVAAEVFSAHARAHGVSLVFDGRNAPAMLEAAQATIARLMPKLGRERASVLSEAVFAEALDLIEQGESAEGQMIQQFGMLMFLGWASANLSSLRARAGVDSFSLVA